MTGEEIILSAKESRFWGSIELSFQDGRIVLIRKTETFKIAHNSSNSCAITFASCRAEGLVPRDGAFNMSPFTGRFRLHR